LLKRFKLITVIVAILMVPALVFSANRFAPAKAVAGTDNTVVVPLEVANEDGVMAIDIPLKYSEGVTLKDVTFENTRVEHFDLKISKIDNEAHTVIIGLIHQLSSTPRATLDAGEGPIANLVFQVDDPSTREITIEKVKMERPSHDLVFIYNTRSKPGQIAFDQVEPEFDRISVALSGVSEGLPTDYALEQNYPNPFNPSTDIQFALPADSKVSLEIYNVLGQRVNTLVNGEMPAGDHTVTWDGRNSSGGSVSSGVYFYRIQATNFVETKKMMMLK
jgi:hypothetical protein